MRSTLLVALLTMFAFGANAQSSSLQQSYIQTNTDTEPSYSISNNTSSPPSSSVDIELGYAGNSFSSIDNGSNPFAYDPATNTMVNIHRNAPGDFGGSTSQYRFDVSTDGGETWDVNLGPLAPTPGASPSGQQAQARYPQAAIHTAENGETYLVYMGATHNGGSGTNVIIWDGIVVGVANINGDEDSFTEHLLPVYSENGGVGIAGGLVKGEPGVFWAVVNSDENSDGTDSPTTNRNIIVLKGIWNDDTNDVDWTETYLEPGVAEDLEVVFDSGNSQLGNISAVNIDFDPTGQYGWILCGANKYSDCGPYNAGPMLYKTEDAGETWEGPITVDMRNIDGPVGDYIAELEMLIDEDPSLAILPTLNIVFENAVAVDNAGNPHFLLPMGPPSTSGPQFYFPDWQPYELIHMHLDGEEWRFSEIDTLSEINVDDPIPGSGTTTINHQSSPQLAKSEDGSKIMFVWTDGEQATPDRHLHSKAYDVESGAYTATNVLDEQSYYFPHVSKIAKETDDGYAAIFTYVFDAADVLSPTYYAYNDEASFSADGFSEEPMGTGVYSPILPSASLDPYELTGTLATFTLKDIEEGNVCAITWDFGDGQMAMSSASDIVDGEIEVQNQYDNADATYTATITIENNDGSETYTQEVEIVFVSDGESAVMELEGDDYDFECEDPDCTYEIEWETSLNDDGDNWEDPEITAIDNVDGDISALVEVDGEIDASQLGEQEITYTVSDGAGNTTTVTIVVTVVDNEAPDLTALSDFSICEEDLDINFLLDNEIVSAEDAVDGDLGADIEISGNDFDTNEFGNSPYEITVTVEDASGNAISEDIEVYVCAGVDIETLTNTFDVYPNPTNGLLNITMTESVNATISVYNILGELVQSTISESSVVFDLSNESTGMYMVEILTEKGTITKKVVVK